MHFEKTNKKRDKRALIILAIFLIIFIPIFIIVNNDGEIFPSNKGLEIQTIDNTEKQ